MIVLTLTADYLPVLTSAGDVDIKVNGITMITLPADRLPGAEPGAEENVIIETLQSFFRMVGDVAISHHETAEAEARLHAFILGKAGVEPQGAHPRNA